MNRIMRDGDNGQWTGKENFVNYFKILSQNKVEKAAEKNEKSQPG
jgi:hypothetical protein